MKNKKKNYLFYFVTAILIGHSVLITSADESELTSLKWLLTADPIQDAKKAFEEGDNRLRAVYGFLLIAPGIDENKQGYYREKYGFNPIEGTSDFMPTEEHTRMNSIAYEYALKYNQYIINRMKK